MSALDLTPRDEAGGPREPFQRIPADRAPPQWSRPSLASCAARFLWIADCGMLCVLFLMTSTRWTDASSGTISLVSWATLAVAILSIVALRARHAHRRLRFSMPEVDTLVESASERFDHVARVPLHEHVALRSGEFAGTGDRRVFVAHALALAVCVAAQYLLLRTVWPGFTAFVLAGSGWETALAIGALPFASQVWAEPGRITIRSWLGRTEPYDAACDRLLILAPGVAGRPSLLVVFSNAKVRRRWITGAAAGHVVRAWTA